MTSSKGVIAQDSNVNESYIYITDYKERNEFFDLRNKSRFKGKTDRDWEINDRSAGPF